MNSDYQTTATALIEEAQRHDAIVRAAKPCPFCGSAELQVVEWWFGAPADDYEAIECTHCRGAAPVRYWNKRTS